MYFIVAIISCIESFAVTIFFVKACITLTLRSKYGLLNHFTNALLSGTLCLCSLLYAKEYLGKLLEQMTYIYRKLMSSGLDFYFFKHSNYPHSVRDIANG